MTYPETGHYNLVRLTNSEKAGIVSQPRYSQSEQNGAIKKLLSRWKYVSIFQQLSTTGELAFAQSASGSNSSTLPSQRLVRARQRKMRRFLIGGILLLIVVLIVGGSYFLPGTTVRVFPALVNALHSNSQQIRIAVDLPLSGDSASSGLPIAGGVEYALAQVNSMHILPAGYSIVAYNAYNGQYDDGQSDKNFKAFYDDQSNPSVGKANVTEALNDGLTAAVIGPYNSGVAQQEIPVTNSAPIAQISPANTDPCLTKDTLQSGCTGSSDLLPTLHSTSQLTYFRLPATDELIVNALVKFLKAQSYQNAYVIYNMQDLYSNFFGKLFIAAWEQAGGTFIGSDVDSGTPTSQDYAGQFQLIPPNVSPDFVFFAGTMPAAANAKEAMAQVPQFRNAAFLGGAGIVLNSFVQNVQGGGPIFAAVPLDDTPTSRQFKTNYLSSGYPSDDYGPYTASASDCVEIVVQAIAAVLRQGTPTPRGSWDMEGAMTFRQAILRAIARITNSSVTGLATNFQLFDSHGDNTNPHVSIYALNNSMWQLQTQPT